MLTIPITDPVIIFAIAMIIFFISPLLMERLRIPGIIGPILAGVIIGPNGLDILARDQTMELLGTVGLLFIIFIAGLELDIDGFKKYRNRSLVFGSLSFFIPLSLGTIISFLFGYSIPAAILIGSILGSHTLLAYPIASRLGISKNKAVTTAVGGTILTDTFALIILAVITGVTKGEVTFQFWVQLLVAIVVFVLIMLKFVPVISRWFFKNYGTEGVTNFTYVMVVLFFAGTLAILAGLQPIIGAFLAGLALNRFIYENGALMNRIRFVGNGLFIPFFLLSVGMLVDLRILMNDANAWILTIAILLAVFVGKGLAPIITGRIYGYSQTEQRLMIGLTIPQAAATLASTLVGYDVGLLNEVTVNAVIIMIIVTCIMGPYLVEKYGRRQTMIEEEIPNLVEQTPERILIPIANPNTMESLIDLANFIKHANTHDQPIYPLSVVRNDIREAQEQVAQAEKMLGHAQLYAAGAEIPIRILTKVDKDIVHGITRAIIEERINTVVLGWHARGSKQEKIATVINRVIEETSETVLITKLAHPLETTKRVVLLIPFGADHKPGFKDAIERIKILTSRIGAELHVIIIKGMVEHYEKHFKAIKPNPHTTYTRVEGWTDLKDNHFQRLIADDLVVLLSARKGTIGWHPELERVPQKLARLLPESFIVYYPTENKEIDVRGAKGIDVPKEVLWNKDYD